MKSLRRTRGRPPKFGRPSQFVALTLPEEVVAGLRRIDADVAWAVVSAVVLGLGIAGLAILFWRRRARGAGDVSPSRG